MSKRSHIWAIIATCICIALGLRLVFGKAVENRTHKRSPKARAAKAETTTVAEVHDEEEAPISSSLAVINENPEAIKYASIGEKICCEHMTELYGKTFKSYWMHNIRNPKTNRKLQLDCWNEESNVAVEYNGIQHYIFKRKFFSNVDEFQRQIYRDEIKAKRCEELGINLIIVPYTVNHNEIASYIDKQLIDRKIHPKLITNK